MSGEALHERGREGAQRAKEWLEATTRVNAQWVNPDRHAIPKLTFEWAPPVGSTFSFDLGGILLGDELAGQEFLAEVKLYSSASDQGTHYESYLAKCYRALETRPDRCDNFMWITWSPFSATTWPQLWSAAKVESSVLKHRERALGDGDGDAEDRLDKDLCAAVARRLWVIVLSERQEKLVVSLAHRAVIRHSDVLKGMSA